MSNLLTFHNVIDGKQCQALSGEVIDVLDPSTARPFATIPRSGADDIDRAAKAAHAAFQGRWKRTTAFDRGRILSKMAAAVLAQTDTLAELETRDTGKPLAQARRDVELLARYFDFYAGAADKLHGETIPSTAGTTVMTIRVPHGVVGQITPWNYPAQMLGRTLGGAIATGNTIVLKPAEEACLTSTLIGQIALDAGLPPGVLNVVCGYGREAGAAMSAHPLVAHISFTGSTATGATVAGAAARRHIPVTMELGGKSPQIVFADADLDAAIPVIFNSIIQNGGQTCTAGSRVLVERSVYDKVVQLLGARFDAARVGPGMDDLECGPLINEAQRIKVQGMIDAAVADGLRIAGKGKMHGGSLDSGSYVLPVLLADASPDQTIATDEVFGPVQVVMAFDTEEEAVELANGTDYGLAAGVWTDSGARQMRMAHAIEAGQVFINGYGAGGGIEIPFGGMKHSGYGREKGMEGLRSYTTLKTVVLTHGFV